MTVARVPNAERFIGQRASPSFYPHLIARNEGVVLTQTHEGVPALTAFSRSEPSGWSVGIGLPEREFTAPLWQSLMMTVLLGMAFLMLGLGLAFWIARGIAAPTLARPGGDRSGRPRSHRDRPRRGRRGRASIAPGDRRTPHGRAGASRLGGAVPPDSRERQGIRHLRPRRGRPGHDLEHRRRAHPRLSRSRRERPLGRSRGRAANERWHLRKDGSTFWGSGVMLPLADHRRGFLKIFRDRTQERAHEEAQKLLIDELNHRVKNTLATVQSIAAQSLKTSETTAQARESFEARLFALAKAHDVLTRESWEGASLRDIVEEALAAHRDARAARFAITGPDVRLAPRAALAMALHELATNAAKYGALSNESG